MREVRKLLDDKGFSSEETRIWELFTLTHSEISEAADAYRKGQDFRIVSEELMDGMIRILHLLSILSEDDPDELFTRVIERSKGRPNLWNTFRGG